MSSEGDEREDEMTDEDAGDGSTDGSDPAPGAELEAADDVDHALDADDLRYPEFVFEEGAVSERGGFDVSRAVSREEMREWLDDLAGGLGSHDVAVETPDGHVTFGVGPGDVEMSFDPDDEFRGELAVTFRLSAKVMKVTDPDAPKVGARGGRGFIPVEALTTDREQFRCYNWIDDPRLPRDGDGGGDGEGADAGEHGSE